MPSQRLSTGGFASRRGGPRDLGAAPLEYDLFFREGYPRLVQLMTVLTRDRHEAEDLAQEAFTRALERWLDVSSMANPEGYVYRIALNLERSRLRRLRALARVMLRLESRQGWMHEGGDAAALAEVAALLGSLREHQRLALLLTEWVGLTSEEAGEVLGVAASTVRARARRARLAMQGLEDENV